MSNLSTITTTAGAITLNANQGATAVAGNFVGVSLVNATITSTNGSISISGRGGNMTGGHGIPAAGSSIMSIGSGDSTLIGIGGAASDDSNGVLLTWQYDHRGRWNGQRDG